LGIKILVMSWFEKLTGFSEWSPAQVRANLTLDGAVLTSNINGRSYDCGKLEIPTLAVLKSSVRAPETYSSRISVREMVGNVQHLHALPENEGALFQAASQFNLLEMVGPSVSPEEGVGIYDNDFTQGPACAIACGAGTIYRNYFVPVGNQIGQTRNLQVDCLDEMGEYFDNEQSRLWRMQNGYALATVEGLRELTERIQSMSEEEYEAVKDRLKIGLQWDAEVTISESRHKVSQAYCSAVPVAYSGIRSEYWEAFAILILEAAYESTLYAALSNYERKGNGRVFLTLLGGGAFGNEQNWILGALQRSLEKFQTTPLEINMVSYGRSQPEVARLATKF